MIIKCNKCHREKKHYMFYKNIYPKKGYRDICIACVKRERKDEAIKKRIYKYNKGRRKPNKRRNINMVLYKKPQMSTSKAKIYKAKDTHLFFQYNAIIYAYAQKEYGLTFNELNLLLMLHPVKPFSRLQAIECRKIMEYKSNSVIKKYLTKDFIYPWYEKEKQATLFDFTERGDKLISDLYDFAIGRRLLPISEKKSSMKIMANLRRLRIES